MSTQVRVNAVAFAEFIAALSMGGHTFQELAEHTGLHIKTVYAYVKALHKAKQVYIESWVKDRAGRVCVAVYRLGHGKDAKKQRVSRAESCRRWRERRTERFNLVALGVVPQRYLEAA